MSNFPSKVNLNQAPAVKGDFASQNPRSSVLAGQGALVAPASGLIVGNFAFVAKSANGDVVSQSFASGDEIGFLAREEQALITAYLAGDTLLVAPGFMVTLYNGGDFYAQFPGGATPGQNVYADESNGDPISAASAPAAASATGRVGTSADFAGSITAGVLTVSAPATTGVTMPGDTITGTGIPAGVTIKAQLTGTIGVAGTYSLNAPNDTLTVAAFTNGQVTFSAFIDFSAVGTGTLVPGANLHSALLAPNTNLGGQQSGSAGAAGIYAITVPQAVTAAGTITTVAGIATGFVVRSFAAAGELAKISASAG